MTELRGAEAFGRVPDPHFRDRLMPERVPCACGGIIDRLRSESVQVVVRKHNRTRQHADWQARQA